MMWNTEIPRPFLYIDPSSTVMLRSPKGLAGITNWDYELCPLKVELKMTFLHSGQDIGQASRHTSCIAVIAEAILYAFWIVPCDVGIWRKTEDQAVNHEVPQ